MTLSHQCPAGRTWLCACGVGVADNVVGKRVPGHRQGRGALHVGEMAFIDFRTKGRPRKPAESAQQCHGVMNYHTKRCRVNVQLNQRQVDRLPEQFRASFASSPVPGWAPGSGVLGLVFDREVFYGSRFRAGEIGHVNLNPGPQCTLTAHTSHSSRASAPARRGASTSNRWWASINALDLDHIALCGTVPEFLQHNRPLVRKLHEHGHGEDANGDDRHHRIRQHAPLGMARGWLLPRDPGYMHRRLNSL